MLGEILGEPGAAFRVAQLALVMGVGQEAGLDQHRGHRWRAQYGEIRGAHRVVEQRHILAHAGDDAALGDPRGIVAVVPRQELGSASGWERVGHYVYDTEV